MPYVAARNEAILFMVLEAFKAKAKVILITQT
jgi:hypothetical protein